MLALRLAAWLFMPLSVCIELLLVGCLLLWSGRRARLGKALVTAGTVLLVAFSLGPTGTALVRPLETAHPAFTPPPDPVRWVVVLGSGYNPDPSLPPTARLTGAAVVRLAEGVRVHKALPGSRLVVMVGGASADDGRVETVREVAGAFGVAPDALVIDAGGRTTAEEADAIRRLVGGERFVMVTSAFHVPRALRLCRDRGLDPLPAPTNHHTGANEYAALDALPSPGNLGLTQVAGYEALRWVARLFGR